jgi:putative transposase
MTDDVLRNRLNERIGRLPHEKLVALEAFLCRLEQAPPHPVVQSTEPRDWPHAPPHRISEHGTYMVTAGTLSKEHHFRTAQRLDLLEGKLLELAMQYGWQLEAWAVFSNHYHFVAHSMAGSRPLNVFLGHLHTATATQINQWDGVTGREVWFNFWETQLTYEKSYFARLHYVHQNAARHGLVRVANQYCWCSAAWLERTATPAQVKTIYSFKIDKLKVFDPFEPIAPTG